MKPLKPFLISLALLITPFCIVFAQKPTYDYVVNNNNDTIKCEIKDPFIGKIKYKPVTATNDRYIQVTPADIKEYYIAKNLRTYVAIVLPGSTQVGYLAILERGKINLYEKVTSNDNSFAHVTSTETRWYVSKDYASLQELKSNTVYNGGSQDDGTLQKKRIEFFMDLIADDAPLLEKFKAGNDFSFNTLESYVQQYNLDKLNSL